MKCNCGKDLNLIETDSRQERTTETYECSYCNKIYLHDTEYNQKGLIENDTFKEVKE